MITEPSGWEIALINTAGLPLMQLGLAWLFTRFPAGWFGDAGRPPRKRPGRGFVGKWKHRVPDGASWFSGGFSKGRLVSREPAYLRRFIRETRRGEACHWCALACCGLFLPLNPWWGDVIIGIYAVAANLPCIVIQRHNRARLLGLLARYSNAEARSARS